MNNSSPMDPQTRRYEEAAEWLFRLQEDSPPNDQIIQWVEWCCADPENRRAFEHLMPVWQAMDASHADAATAALLARERLPLQNPHPAPLPFRTPASRRVVASKWLRSAARRHRRSLAAIAAGLLLSMGLLLPRIPGNTTLTPVASFASKIGQVRAADLPDGSHIDLGARSEVAINFQGGRRQIEVKDGEAFFKVKHDKTRPFVVEVGSLQVVAVGTAFDVLRTGDRVTVTVEEGVVEVTAGQWRDGAAGLERSDGRSDAPQTVQLPRGSQIVFDAARASNPTVRIVDPQSADAWRKGRFEYVDEPLSSVVANLNRYSAGQIVLQDERLGQLSYTGTIELHSIDEWLQALPSIFPLHVEFGADHKVTLQRVASANSRH